jgi:hypothetical protein
LPTFPVLLHSCNLFWIRISKQPTCLKSRNLLSIKKWSRAFRNAERFVNVLLTNHGMFYSAHAVDHRFL